MAYRDDVDGLRVRVADLEQQLEEQKQTVSRLRGLGREVPDADESVDWVSGVPRQLLLERELPFEVTERGLEAIADLIADRMGGNRVSQVGRTLTHGKPGYALRLALADGKTRLRVSGDFRGARRGLLLATPGIGLLSVPFTSGLLTAFAAGPMLMAIGVVAGVVASVWGMRWLLRSNQLKQRRDIIALFEAVSDVAAQHQLPKSRIEAGDTAAPPRVEAVDDQAEQERQAEQEMLAADGASERQA